MTLISDFCKDTDKIDICPRQSLITATSSTNSFVASFFAIPLYIARLTDSIDWSFDNVLKCSCNTGNEHHKVLTVL